MSLTPGQHLIKVFIGRFQPFHNGHLKCLRAAIDTSSHVVLVIGSANTGQSLKNPWSFVERTVMIRNALRPGELKKVSVRYADDFPGNDKAWVRQIRDTVYAAAETNGFAPKKCKYTLVGCHKGADTYYLKLYRGWNMDLIPSNEALNATDIRKAYFGLDPFFGDNIPASSRTLLWAWQHYKPNDFQRFRLDLLAEERQRNS